MPAITQAQPSGKGWASLPFKLANAPGLVGLQALAQWYVADPAPGFPYGALSRALHVTIQP